MRQCFDDLESKMMAKNLRSGMKLKRLIKPNPLWWSRHVRFTRKLFGMELNHWHINKRQNVFALPNHLASNAWMNKVAILCARIYEKVMWPNILALPQTPSQSPFYMSSWMLTGIIAAQSTDMQCSILFSNISNREIKRRFRSVDTVAETSPDVRRKLLVHACIIGLPALKISCA